MNVLVLDCCLAACQAAVVRDGEPVEALCEPMRRGHQERLAPMVAEAMGAAGTAFPDLDAIAVTVGPGSFTGLRVGLAFARGLALALGRPVLGAGTLPALAASVPGRGPRAAVIDAGRGRLYWQAFDDGEAVESARCAPIGEAVALLRSMAADVLLAGPGAELLAGAMPAAQVRRLTAPAPRAIARVALAAGAGSLSPIYLRAADAAPLRIMPGVTLRPAGAGEAAVLADLLRSATADAWKAEDLGRLAGDGIALIAEVEALPRGCILSRLAADEGEILTLAVHPNWRRRGLGARLLGRCLRALAERGARRVFLEVAIDNAAALALYARFGFRRVSVRAGYYRRTGGALDALVLRADL